MAMTININNYKISIIKTKTSGFLATIYKTAIDYVGRDVEVFITSESHFKNRTSAKKWALKFINSNN